MSKEYTLIEALNFIQTNLAAPKSKENKFGNYKYRDAESILMALKPMLIETGCVLTTNSTIEVVGERYYVKSTSILTAKDGSEATAIAYAREDESKKGMDGSQLTGSCSSYARKYSLCNLLSIDDGNDADVMNNKVKATLQDAIASLMACETMEDLQREYLDNPEYHSQKKYVETKDYVKKVIAAKNKPIEADGSK